MDTYTDGVKYGFIKITLFQDGGDVLINMSINDDPNNIPNAMVEAL